MTSFVPRFLQTSIWS